MNRSIPYFVLASTKITNKVRLCTVYLYKQYSYSHPITGLDGTLGFQKVEVPRISRQSTHEGGKPYIPAVFIDQEISLVLIYARGSVDPGTILLPEGLSMKNLKDAIGNWSRDILGSNAGPQKTALPRVPTLITNTRLKQTRLHGNEETKTCAWQMIRCPRAWTKSIVRSIPRQYTEVSGADIGIVLWVVTCYLTWIGTPITNTELLRESASEHLTKVFLDEV